MKIDSPTKIRIIELRAQGTSLNKISQELNVSKGGVRRVLRVWRESGDIKRKEGSGRPRKLSARSRLRLIRSVQKDPQQTATNLATEYSVSHKTIRRELARTGFCRITLPHLYEVSPKNQIERVRWAERHLAWREDDWRRIIFSDEVMIAVDTEKLRIWRRKNDKKAMVGTRKQYPVKVMLWGCFGYDRVGKIIRVEGSIDSNRYFNIIYEHLLTSFNMTDGNLIFQHDNATPHTKAEQDIKGLGVRLLPWPAQSPDLNPIENIWGIIKRRVRVKMCKTEEDLISNFTREWYSLQSEFLCKLYDSMPRRISAVIQSKGLPTKY